MTFDSGNAERHRRAVWVFLIPQGLDSDGQRVRVCCYRGYERFATIASVCLCPVERDIGRL
jgi:hypothetical protein